MDEITLLLDQDKDLITLIQKASLLNAIQHKGKAQAGAILGKIIVEKQDLKAKIKELSKLINQIIAEINKLSIDEQKQIVIDKWPEALNKEKKIEKKSLPPLANIEKYASIVTRFSPNPDCVLHLGSARAIILSHEYARKNNGKFILRFEDTDPKVKQPILEFYEKIREDLAWLGCNVDAEYIQSDRLPIYYEYAHKLLSQGNAYVCKCVPDDFRRKIIKNQACNCRVLAIEKNLERWNLMLKGSYLAGEAVVRIKTDINHPNPAVRDWPALRIIDNEKFPHPRVGSKYHVWPLYNIAAGIDDHLMGITHIIRGKEHLTNAVRQKYMYAYLGWNYPETIHYGRLKITGAYLSKSKIVQGVKEGVYTGWDDPRLATFVALKKRGITPESIKKMIIDVGPKTADVTLSWENLYSHNRKIIDLQSNRYFLVLNPIKLRVKGVPSTFKVNLKLHPQRSEKGFRKYTIVPKGDLKTATFWIDKNDIVSLSKGSVLRLMDLFNVEFENVCGNFVEASFNSGSYAEARKSKSKFIHWISQGEELPCTVVMPNTKINEGIAESACKNLKPDTIIQFERFGFVRVHQNDKKLVAYYSHK
ncbi:glutamate--tRNA ligase [Candidatus Bathyarchaeota archaeon]|nr:glutamate--tRNA ligase [Candidatus Bathyarchaeota archaeon]